MLLIDATLAVLSAQGRKADGQLTQKWIKALTSIGVGGVKRPREPVVALEAIYGCDSVFSGDYAELFRDLRRLEPFEVVFGDSQGFATALATAWLEEGGSRVVASLAGVGGLPALETLRLFLRQTGRLPLPEAGRPLAKVIRLYEIISGRKISLFQPVLGQGLFAAESGVHVDSWAKDPSMYEPFPPELTGAKRLLAIGRHSGRGAVDLKCRQLGLDFPGEAISSLLALVRDKAVGLGRSLSEDEFAALARSLMERSLES
jgi:homocitrate synthase NifV